MTTTIDELTEEQIDQLLHDVRTGTWLDAQEFPPLNWAVPQVIPEGFGLLVGPPKLGKSWFVLGLALAVASGGRALGRIAVGPPRPVFYLALEDGDRRLQDRSRTLLRGGSIPENFHRITQINAGQVLLTIEAFLARHGHLQPLILLDTLGKVMPPALPGEGAYARDYRIGSALKRLSDQHPGTSLLVVHHSRKAISEDWMDNTSGTNGLNGSADFTISLARTRNDSDALLQVTGRDVVEANYACTTSGGTWALRGKSLAESAEIAKQQKATAGLADDSANVVEFVIKAKKPVKANDVATALGLPTEKARVYLGRAVDSGRLRRAGRGLYTSVMSVTSVMSPEVLEFPKRNSDDDEVEHHRRSERERNNITDITHPPEDGA